MNILLVDDDQESRASVADFLREMGHQVTECGNGEDGLRFYTSGDFPMVLSDIKMPKMSGLELLRTIHALPNNKRDTDVVLYTGHSDMNSAIAALRAGAYDYLVKPINVDELAAITERIAEHQALKRENKLLTQHFDDQVKAATAVTQQELSQLKKRVAQWVGLSGVGIFSEAMSLIVQQAQKYHVDRMIPVLIQGETGTGKEIIAKIIHYGNMEDPKPYVDINCAALTPTLFESELFGYEAGAFTGSLIKGQRGKLDLAQAGTLFLDEVGEIPLELQGKLLRVIQEKEFYRVGGLKKIKTDVRIICATNVDLKKRVEQGTFREDLYYRLKVGHLEIPPLRQRMEEVLPLANMFLQEFTRQKGKSFLRIGELAADLLREYHWPGNVRELRNVMEWVTFMHDDTVVKPEHLGIIAKDDFPVNEGYQGTHIVDPNQFALPAGGLSLEEYVNKIVSKALEINQGNKTKTARYLGISRRSLYCRLEHLKEFNNEEQLV